MPLRQVRTPLARKYATARTGRDCHEQHKTTRHMFCFIYRQVIVPQYCIDSTRLGLLFVGAITFPPVPADTQYFSYRLHGFRFCRVSFDRSVAVHPRVLGAYLAVQGRRERPGCGR